jgi:hypothetical protein
MAWWGMRDSRRYTGEGQAVAATRSSWRPGARGLAGGGRRHAGRRGHVELVEGDGVAGGRRGHGCRHQPAGVQPAVEVAAQLAEGAHLTEPRGSSSGAGAE